MTIRTALLIALMAVVSHAVADQRTVTLDIPKMDCPLCPITIETALKNLDGVSSIETSLDTRSATVTFDETLVTVDELIAATTNAGYPSTVVQ